MCNKITAAAGILRCEVGKKTEELRDGHYAVNVFTNFDPLDHPIFLLDLKDSEVVSRIANTAFYGPGNGGGITVYLDGQKSEQDLCSVLQQLLESASENMIE